MIQTILVPLDGSTAADQSLVPACRIAKETGAALRLVRAVPFSAFEEAEREKESPIAVCAEIDGEPIARGQRGQAIRAF
ncbi:MAG TPA: universal stress protein [Chloroflexota bacterium]|nr:universal stress protein [Chloroflexota bacterium]